MRAEDTMQKKEAAEIMARLVANRARTVDVHADRFTVTFVKGCIYQMTRLDDPSPTVMEAMAANPDVELVLELARQQ